jgi:hypothetical protein
MAWLNGGDPLSVEARDQAGDRLPAAATGGLRRVGVALSVYDGEQGFGASDVSCWFGLGTSYSYQPVAFVVGKRPQRIRLSAGHRRTSRVG